MLGKTWTNPKTWCGIIRNYRSFRVLVHHRIHQNHPFQCHISMMTGSQLRSPNCLLRSHHLIPPQSSLSCQTPAAVGTHHLGILTEMPKKLPWKISPNHWKFQIEGVSVVHLSSNLSERIFVGKIRQTGLIYDLKILGEVNILRIFQRALGNAPRVCSNRMLGFS